MTGHPLSRTPDGESRELVIEVAASVRIDITDAMGVIGRYLEGGEFFGEHPYGLTTEKEIVSHLAYNAVANGVTHANALEGWADLASDAARMEVLDVEALDA